MNADTNIKIQITPDQALWKWLEQLAASKERSQADVQTQKAIASELNWRAATDRHIALPAAA